MNRHYRLLRPSLILGALGIIFLALIISFPFFWMISTSLKTLKEAVAFPPTLIPHDLVFSNFQSVFESGDFTRYLLNSVIYASSIGLGVAITSFLAGYAFAALRFPGKELLFVFFLVTFMIPPELAVIPNFLIIKNLGLYNTYGGMVLPGLAHAFSIFLLRQAFRSIPDDFFEAASLDGCGHLKYLTKIALPIVWPTLIVVTFLSFVRAWNDLLWPLIIVSGKQMYTVQVGLIAFSQQAAADFPLLMAGSTVAILPVIALFLLVQRNVIEGIAHSGLQGT